MSVLLACVQVAVGSSTTPGFNITMVITARFDGASTAAQKTANTLQSSPCTLSNLCDSIQQLSVRYIYPDVVQAVDLNLTLVSYTPGTLKFITTYTEDATAVANHVVFMTTNSADPMRGKLGACTTTVDSANAIFWECFAIIPASVTIQLTATTLVPTDPSTPISRSVLVPGVGCEKGNGPGPDGITCVPCPKGQYSPSGVCFNCTAGFTTAGTGSENCTGKSRATVRCSRAFLGASPK